MRRRASGKSAKHQVFGGILLSMILRWRRWAHALRFSLAASACNGAAAHAACSMMYVKNLPSPFATLCLMRLTAVPPPPRRPLTPDAVRKHANKTGVRSFSLREKRRRERSSLFCRHTLMVSLRRSNARVVWYMKWTTRGRPSARTPPRGAGSDRSDIANAPKWIQSRASSGRLRAGPLVFPTCQPPNHDHDYKITIEGLADAACSGELDGYPHEWIVRDVRTSTFSVTGIGLRWGFASVRSGRIAGAEGSVFARHPTSALHLTFFAAETGGHVTAGRAGERSPCLSIPFCGGFRDIPHAASHQYRQQGKPGKRQRGHHRCCLYSQG